MIINNQYDQLVKNIDHSGDAHTIDVKKLAFGQEPTDHMLSILSKNGIW